MLKLLKLIFVTQDPRKGLVVNTLNNPGLKQNATLAEIKDYQMKLAKDGQPSKIIYKKEAA